MSWKVFSDRKKLSFSKRETFTENRNGFMVFKTGVEVKYVYVFMVQFDSFYFSIWRSQFTFMSKSSYFDMIIYSGLESECFKIAWYFGYGSTKNQVFLTWKMSRYGLPFFSLCGCQSDALCFFINASLCVSVTLHHGLCCQLFMWRSEHHQLNQAHE